MIFSTGYAESARILAEHLMRRERLACASAVLKSLLAAADVPVPSGFMAMASGFGKGMGEAGCTCGALVGAVMAAGVLFDTPEGGRGQELARRLHDEFKALNGATCCRVLRHGLAYGTAGQFEACVSRSAGAAAMAAGVFLEFAKSPVHVLC